MLVLFQADRRFPPLPAGGLVAHGILDGRVRLEVEVGHTGLETVQVNAGNEGAFRIQGGFALDDGSQGQDLVKGQALLLSQAKGVLGQVAAHVVQHLADQVGGSGPVR